MTAVVEAVSGGLGAIVDGVSKTASDIADGWHKTTGVSLGDAVMVAAVIYTGGVAMGAWGQGGWLASTMGVSSTAGSAATGTAASTSGAASATQGGMLAAQTAEFGAVGANLTAEALATNAAAGAATANAGIMSQYASTSTQLGQAGAAQSAGSHSAEFAKEGVNYNPAANTQTNELAQGGFDSAGNPVETSTNSMGTGQAQTEASKTFMERAGDSYESVKESLGFKKEAANAGISPLQEKGWWESLGGLEKMAIIQTGGQVISGVGTSMGKDEELKARQSEIDGGRDRAGSWVSMNKVYEPGRTGLLSGAMSKPRGRY